MADRPEDVRRRDAQRNALQVQGGARIDLAYLSRKSEVVGVNKNDLHDLLQFDGTELLFMTIGQFFLAGATWLLVEKLFSPEFKWDALSGFCVAAIVFGVVMIAGSLKLRSMKRGKIQRIFQETTPVEA